jgi:putative transcriptional regulator
MLKFTPDNNPAPSRGCILLSEPFLEDPNFKRTVILLGEHNEEGSFGFVLNNYVDLTLDRIMPDLPAFNNLISIGGPVRKRNLYYIHTLGDRLSESMKITEGIYMGGNFEELKKLAAAGLIGDDEIRFFVGYSGWSAGQLQEELEGKSWFVTQAQDDLLMNTHIDDLWGKLVQTLGKEYAHLVHLPNDPSLN